jgi:single-strand DNA-binding protein
VGEEGLNRVLLLGRVGSDPELRQAGNTPVLKLRLATSETYLDRNKVRQERTEWVNICIFGRRAEALSKFLAKGARIFVEGSLRTSSYEKNGEKRYRTEVIASNIILAGGKRDGGGSAGGERESSRTAGGGFDDSDYGPNGGEDDLDGVPF